MTTKEDVEELNRKVMRMINPKTGEMECKICGQQVWASKIPYSEGSFFRDSWHCINGCKFKSNGIAWNGAKKKNQNISEGEGL